MDEDKEIGPEFEKEIDKIFDQIWKEFKEDTKELSRKEIAKASFRLGMLSHASFMQEEFEKASKEFEKNPEKFRKIIDGMNKNDD